MAMFTGTIIQVVMMFDILRTRMKNRIANIHESINEFLVMHELHRTRFDSILIYEYSDQLKTDLRKHFIFRSINVREKANMYVVKSIEHIFYSLRPARACANYYIVGGKTCLILVQKPLGNNERQKTRFISKKRLAIVLDNTPYDLPVTGFMAFQVIR